MKVKKTERKMKKRQTSNHFTMIYLNSMALPFIAKMRNSNFVEPIHI
jgi:hypothetical protein